MSQRSGLGTVISAAKLVFEPFSMVCEGVMVEPAGFPSGAMTVTSSAAFWVVADSFTTVLWMWTVAPIAVMAGVVTNVLHGSR